MMSKKQEIDVYIIRGKLSKMSEVDEEYVIGDDIGVIEEYDGNLLLLQTNDLTSLLSVNIDHSPYNLTDYLRKNIGSSSGIVKIDYITFVDGLGTINPFKIKESVSRKKSHNIYYNTIEDFSNQFNNAMNRFCLEGSRYICVYMEIAVHKNNDMEEKGGINGID